jgi:SAM-dependent methyltransferase
MKLFYHLWYRFGTPPWVMGVRPELEKLVLDGVLQPKRALDLGCGTGGNVNWLATRGVDATGVDFARSAIDRAIKDAVESDSGATFTVDDITKLETVSGKFDLIIDYGSIDDLDRKKRQKCVDRIEELAEVGTRLFMYCFEWEPIWWERLLGKILPFGEGIIRPGEAERLFSDRWDIELLERNETDGFPRVISVYLMSRKSD